MHGKILTGENLEKKGIEGPFICPLCCENNETNLHLFFECNYARTMWSMLTKLWFGRVEILGNVQQCFTNWEKAFKGDLNNKKGVKDCWMKLPKIICWHIWIERNLRTFRNKARLRDKIVAKTQALMGEIIKTNAGPKNKTNLVANKIIWMQTFIF